MPQASPGWLGSEHFLCFNDNAIKMGPSFGPSFPGQRPGHDNSSKTAQLVRDRAGAETDLFFLPSEAKPWTANCTEHPQDGLCPWRGWGCPEEGNAPSVA